MILFIDILSEVYIFELISIVVCVIVLILMYKFYGDIYFVVLFNHNIF